MYFEEITEKQQFLEHVKPPDPHHCSTKLRPLWTVPFVSKGCSWGNCSIQWHSAQRLPVWTKNLSSSDTLEGAIPFPEWLTCLCYTVSWWDSGCQSQEPGMYAQVCHWAGRSFLKFADLTPRLSTLTFLSSQCFLLDSVLFSSVVSSHAFFGQACSNTSIKVQSAWIPFEKEA